MPARLKRNKTFQEVVMSTPMRTNWRTLAGGFCLLGALSFVLAGGCPPANDLADLLAATQPDASSDTGTSGSGAGSTGGAGGSQNTAGNDTGSSDAGGDDSLAEEAAIFTLTVTAEGEGTVEPTGGNYEKDTKIELRATPGAGWRFDHWAGDTGGQQNPLMLVMDRDYSITAVFTAVIVFPLPQFRAIYDPIVDSATLGDSVGRSGDYGRSICAVSSDGQRVAFGNTYGGPDRRLYLVNSNGTSLTAYDLPGNEGTTSSIAIDADGSRVFVADPYAANQAIYKLEGGVITTIPLAAGPGSPGATWDICTTEDGGWVYFLASYDIWRVRHDGSSFERIVNHAAVPCTDAGYGGPIQALALSADGGVLAFNMLVIRDYPGRQTTDAEVFTLDHGVLRQLTDDRKGVAGKGGLWISGNGGTIVYTDTSLLQKHITIRPSGSDRRVLEGGTMYGHGALNYDGSRFLGFSPLAIVNTDGSGVLQILPPNWLGASDSLWMNANASQVFFRHLYSESPYGARLYTGYFNDPVVVTDVPVIGEYSFHPSAMPRGDASAKVILSAAIHYATQVDAFEMLAGRYEGNANNLPAAFPVPKDDGQGYDAVAGDGTFTAVGVPCAKVNDLNEVTIRLAARDAQNAVVLVDGVLHVGP
jgi:hypothetical protein